MLLCETRHQIESLAYTLNNGTPAMIAVASSALEGSIWKGSVSILDGKTGEQFAVTTINAGISQIKWSSENVLLAACDDGRVRHLRLDLNIDFAWNLSEENPLDEGHDDIVSCLAIQKDLIISGSFDTTLKLWTEENKSLRTFYGKKKIILKELF